MSRRTSIVKALVEKFKTINGRAPYSSNLFGNIYPLLKFWDEVFDFPGVYLSAGNETREYLPANFTWAYLGITIRIYCKGEGASDQLEDIIADLETCINANRVLVYDSSTNDETTEILITSITTDEGLLDPYAVGEMNIQVRYALV